MRLCEKRVTGSAGFAIAGRSNGFSRRAAKPGVVRYVDADEGRPTPERDVSTRDSASTVARKKPDAGRVSAVAGNDHGDRRGERVLRSPNCSVNPEDQSI